MLTTPPWRRQMIFYRCRCRRFSDVRGSEVTVLWSSPRTDPSLGWAEHRNNRPFHSAEDRRAARRGGGRAPQPQKNHLPYHNPTAPQQLSLSVPKTENLLHSASSMYSGSAIGSSNSNPHTLSH